MAQAAKYLFDRNFEAPANDAEPVEVARERELRAQFERELESVRDAEYRRGLADGQTQAGQTAEAGTEKAVAQIAGSANALLKKLDGECAAMRAEAVKIAVAAADRLASELVRREPTALLEALFADCLEHLADAPHVAIRVHDSIAGRLQEKLAAAAAAKGFPGRIIVLGDPETAKGDCRIEWADGGISRDFESLRLGISEIVTRHLAARANGYPATDRDEARDAPLQNPAPPHTPPPVAQEPAGNPHIQTNGSGEHP